MPIIIMAILAALNMFQLVSSYDECKKTEFKTDYCKSLQKVVELKK